MAFYTSCRKSSGGRFTARIATVVHIWEDVTRMPQLEREELSCLAEKIKPHDLSKGDELWLSQVMLVISNSCLS